MNRPTPTWHVSPSGTGRAASSAAGQWADRRGPLGALAVVGMGVVIASTTVLLLELSPPQEAGANSAALQISDGLPRLLAL